jgi:predicted enzyme related to lactoylglutathione lyase
MSGPAQAGLFLYAKDLSRVAHFYEAVLRMFRLHATDEIIVLQSQDIQLVVHQIPASIASTITLTTPPTPREDTAIKFFFTVSSIDGLRSQVAALGGIVFDKIYQGSSFQLCNVCDPEGNIFQVRQPTS